MKKHFAVLLFAFLCAHAGDPQRLRIGAPTTLPATSPVFTLFTIDGAKKTAAVFQASDPDVVTTLLFRYGARTGTPVQHRISIQGVDASNGAGTPNGIVLAAAAFTPPADTSWNGFVRAVSITNDGSGAAIAGYTLTRGAFYSIVIEPCPDSTAPCSGAATANSSNSSSFTSVLTNVVQRPTPPYGLTYASSAWSKINEAPLYGYRTASATRGLPVQSTTSTTISSGSESAVSFMLPSTMCGAYTVVGVRAVITSPAANKTFKINLYNGTTVLQSVTADSDVGRSYSSVYNTSEYYFADASLTPLTCGSTYRIGFAPQDASNGIGLTTLDVAAGGDRTAFSGGTMFAFASRTGCGGPCDATSTAWAADTVTSRPMLELILDDLTPPAATGGQKSYTFVGALLADPLHLFHAGGQR
jgi:hypothetical protein